MKCEKIQWNKTYHSIFRFISAKADDDIDYHRDSKDDKGDVEVVVFYQEHGSFILVTTRRFSEDDVANDVSDAKDYANE